MINNNLEEELVRYKEMIDIFHKCKVQDSNDKTEMMNHYEQELEKKNKQICNLELYINELSAKLKIANDNLQKD